MYNYLKGETKDCGSPDCLATIASSTGSVLTWLGGPMPPGGASSNPAAVSDLQAWVASGSPNN